MRTLIIALVALCLVAAPAAQASDASLRRVVEKQGAKFDRAVERYDRAVGVIETEEDLQDAKRETKRLARATGKFRTAVKAERAGTTKLKRARTKLLDALATYKRGLDKLVRGIEQDSGATINSAKRILRRSGEKFEAAAKAFG